MKQVGARHDIIREWRSLPKEQRQTDEQAEAFATQIKDKYKFSNDSADPYQTVRGWLLSYLSLTRGLGVNAKDKGEMHDDEKSTDPGLSAAERKLSECGRRKRRSPTMKKPRQHSMKIGSASAKNAWFERRPRSDAGSYSRTAGRYAD